MRFNFPVPVVGMGLSCPEYCHTWLLQPGSGQRCFKLSLTLLAGQCKVLRPNSPPQANSICSFQKRRDMGQSHLFGMNLLLWVSCGVRPGRAVTKVRTLAVAASLSVTVPLEGAHSLLMEKHWPNRLLPWRR